MELDTGGVIKEELDIGAAVLQPEVKLESGTEDLNVGTMSDQMLIKEEPVEEYGEPVDEAVLVKHELDIGPTVLQPTDMHYQMAEPKQELIKDEPTEGAVGGGAACSGVDQNMSCADCNSGTSKTGQFSNKTILTRKSSDILSGKKCKEDFISAIEWPYLCEVCHKGFDNKSDLIRHLLIHTGVRPHSCDVCHKKFTRKTNLNRHVSTHTGDRPHSCDVCGKDI